jgi:1,2-dihydroxy-3-keto-5-methylthiopentene dioxygenase
MAVLTIPDQNRILRDYDKVRDFLAGINIVYEHWEPVADLQHDASYDEILSAYSKQINELKRRGRYVTADVITVNKDTPGLDAMLAKFNIEHRHDEDEVRYILSGRGLFHIHLQQQQQEQQQQQRDQVVAVEVEAGDLICIPRNTLHWFNLCGDRKIRAIRLFQDVSGWTPYYTHSSIDRKYEPVCWGPRYIQSQTTTIAKK